MLEGNVISNSPALAGTQYKGVFFIRAMTTASGPQVISIGFAPRVIICMAQVSNVAGMISWGMAVKGDAGSPAGSHSRHNVAANQWSGNSASNQIAYMRQGGGNDYNGSVLDADFGSDGITINWVRIGAPTGNMAVHITFFK